MADWGHPASLPSPLDMIYLPPHLPRIFNHGRRCDCAYAVHASADTVVTKNFITAEKEQHDRTFHSRRCLTAFPEALLYNFADVSGNEMKRRG